MGSDVWHYVARLEAERNELLTLLRRIEDASDKPALGVKGVTFSDIELMTAVHTAVAKTENAQTRE